MKKTIIAAAIATIAFISCNKTETPQNQMADAANVSITLSGDLHTRAFYDNSSIAEAWESALNTIAIYAFDASGNFVLRRDFTAAEVTARKATFAMPNSTKGTSCTFVAVANADYGAMASLSAFNAALEAADPDDYNGSFSEVTSGSKRPEGFVMNGSTTATVAANTPLAITLKRLAAKIAVRTTVSSDFAAKYNGGDVKITSATLSKTSRMTYSLPQAGVYAPRASLYSHTQQTGGSSAYDNLFYSYENDEQPDANKVALTLAGIYDADGNFSTTHDQSNVEYIVPLDGSGNGKINRNAYYRVGVTINGLSGSSIDATITVADWDGPVTENHDLGD